MALYCVPVCLEGVGLITPAIVVMALFNCPSTFFTCGLFIRNGEQYSAAEILFLVFEVYDEFSASQLV